MNSDSFNGVIYKVTNLINGKIYIGQTINYKRRHKDHLSPRYIKKDNAAYFHKALNCHGEKNFIWEIIDTGSSYEELNKKESAYILQFNSIAPNGYNCNYGGNNKAFSESSRQKQSLSQKNRFLNPEQRKERSRLQSPITKKMWDDPEYLKRKDVKRYKAVDDIIEIAKQYRYYADFVRESSSAYVVAHRNGWLDKIRPLFKEKKPVWNKGKGSQYTREQLFEIVKQLTTWKDFHNNYRTAFKIAKKENLYYELKTFFKDLKNGRA